MTIPVLETPRLILRGHALKDFPNATSMWLAALEQSLKPYYPAAQFVAFVESGHYPMQEQPPLFATMIERFLRQS